MKHLLLTTIAAGLLTVCVQASECVPQKTSPKGTLEARLVSFLENGERCIAVAQFGIYKSVAVLNLEPQGVSSDSDRVPIKGSYYYVRHAKEIHLEGYLEKRPRRLVMKESYNGESTGHFQFSADDSGGNYWSPPESTREDDATFITGEDDAVLIHVFSYDSSIGEKDIASMRFTSIVKVRDYTLPEDAPRYERENRVWACKLPDNSIAFEIYVIGQDWHFGQLKGIAFSDHLLGKTYEHESIISGDKCEVWIELNDQKNLIFKNEECFNCCGVFVSLTGEYNYRDEVKLFADTGQLKAEGK